MQNKRQLTIEIELTRAIESLAQAYEGISVMQIQKVREKVIKSRQFLENLEVVFGDVRDSYKKQLDEFLQKKKGLNQGSLSMLSKNGKSAVIFMSANTPLYGEIIPKVFEQFLEYVRKNDVDVVVIGRFGKKLFEEAGLRKNYLYFDLPDTSVQFADLREVLLKIIPYQRVDVFYGQFENAMNQSARSGNISGQTFFEAESVNRESHKIVFEPSLENVFQFFETQVFNNLFHQIVQEAELARHGSRIKAMETAIDRIEREEKSLLQQKSSLKKMIDNKKRLEGLAGMSLWR